MLERARAFLAQHWAGASLVFTERPGHGTELARRALDAGCDLVVAIGGDGTMNEVAQTLVGTSAVFGLIPCGSGNGLGRHLGIPGPGCGAFRTLLHGRPRAIDTGTVNGLPFFNTMGLGFDAEIGRRFNLLKRRSLVHYLRVGAGAFFRFQSEALTIRNGIREVATRAMLVTVANSDQYGNNAFVAPGARVDDGELDLVAVKAIGFFGLLPLTARLFLGSFDRSSSVLHLRGCHFIIRRDAPGVIHTDGELHETGAEIDVSIRPRSLRVMVPA